MKNIFNKFKSQGFLLFCILILALSLRGIYGNPIENNLNIPMWKDDGPLELSPERGRFALMMSVVEDKSLYFSLPIARFATPDLGYKNGNFVSLFAPGVSFLIIPGYVIGKILGISQVGSYAMITIFALVNALLIRSIAIKLKANRTAATIAAFTFLFATPAFTYGVSLFQHHISAFLILLSLFLLMRRNNFLSLALIWFVFAVSIVIDYPNLFFMLPLTVFATGRIIFTTIKENSITININMPFIFSFFTIIFPLTFFFWFNNVSYGNPFQLSGTIGVAKSIDETGKPLFLNTDNADFTGKDINKKDENRSATAFFFPRNILNGLYIHFISPDRGIIYFAPVVLFGVFGWLILYNKNQKIAALYLAVIGANILLYSMWFDPWGGWAFGSRYLIPSYALLSILLALLLDKYRKNTFLLIVFFIVLTFSFFVNSLGAITTSRNPPQVEVLALEKVSGKEEKYTYERNWDYLNDIGSKAFVWQTFAKENISAVQYYYFINSLLLIGASILFFKLRLGKQV